MKWLKRYLSKIITIAIVIIGIRFARDLQDWHQLLRYQAPLQVAQLADNTTMTDTARKFFYLNQPTIEPRKSANNLCKSTEHTVVLGCYVVGKGIFLQKVSDPRLQGVMEVTAAHETLHVAYQRMSLFEQTQLNKLLQAAFEQLQNPRIQRLIEAYREQDETSVNTELHSILGTEVRNLPPGLEEHYRQYFTDRSKIVALSERYEGVFTALKSRGKTLNQELVKSKSAMEQLRAQVKSEGEIVEEERSSIQGSMSNTSIAAYNFRIANYNDRVQNYRHLVERLQAQTDAYNQLVNEYNSLTLEEKSLIDSLQNKSPQQIAR